MTSAAIELNNPFSRHRYLPTAMNWLNEWNAQTLYFNNDIAISPITSAAYIFYSDQTSIIGGGDPSTNPLWYLFALNGDEVVNIRTGDGIGLSGGPTNPTIDNTGVNTIVLQNNIQNIGTNTNQILENTGVDAITGTLGINAAQDPVTFETTVTNTGVTALVVNPTSGISLNSTTGEVQITNSGVMSLVSSDANLTVTGLTTKQVDNNGLLSIAVTGAGLANTGTATSPIFSNLGVIDISGDGSMIIGGTKQDVKLGVNLPKLCLVFPTFSSPQVQWVVGTEGLIAVPNPVSLFSTCLSTGQPHSTGTFVMTIPLTVFLGKYTGITRGASLSFDILDTVNGKRYSLPSASTIFYNASTDVTGATNAYTTILNIRFDLAAARTAGVRQFNQLGITFLNPAVPMTNAYIASSGACFAVYYPQTLNYV